MFLTLTYCKLWLVQRRYAMQQRLDEHGRLCGCVRLRVPIKNHQFALMKSF